MKNATELLTFEWTRGGGCHTAFLSIELWSKIFRISQLKFRKLVYINPWHLVDETIMMHALILKRCSNNQHLPSCIEWYLLDFSWVRNLAIVAVGESKSLWISRAIIQCPPSTGTISCWFFKDEEMEKMEKVNQFHQHRHLSSWQRSFALNMFSQWKSDRNDLPVIRSNQLIVLPTLVVSI